jgi:hypothetical protein
LELHNESSIDVLDTLVLHPFCNQFCQYPLCNFYRLWQPDQLRQLLLGLVRGLWHWLLKYLKARNVRDQFDNQFTCIREYPGLLRFSKPFGSMKRGSWVGEEIWSMTRTLGANCCPVLDCFQDASKALGETASDEMLMGTVLALCQCSLHVRQQNEYDQSFVALGDALKRFCQKKGAFRDRKMSMSVKATVDEIFASESDQLGEQHIYRISATMEVPLNSDAKVTTCKQRQFQFCLIE